MYVTVRILSITFSQVRYRHRLFNNVIITMVDRGFERRCIAYTFTQLIVQIQKEVISDLKRDNHVLSKTQDMYIGVYKSVLTLDFTAHGKIESL